MTPPPLDANRIASIWDVIAGHAEAAPDAPALRFEGRVTSYAGLLRDAAGRAALLAGLGVGPGQRVGYLGKNSDLYFVLLYAVARLGAVLVPLNWRLCPEEWAFIAEDAAISLLFADETFMPDAQRLAALRPMRAPLLLDREQTHDAPLPAPPQADDVVLQVYTSGTTGRPKGAMLSHRNMLALRDPGYRAGLAWFPGPADTSLVILPVAHIAGTAYALFGIYGGGCVLLAREFDPLTALDLLGNENVSHMLLAPAAMRQLLDHPAAATTDFSRLRYITYGASPIPEALLAHAIAVFGCRFVQMYGMTEAAGGVVALSPEDHEGGAPERLRSAGRAMPGVEIAVLDPDGAMLGAEGIGEIAVKSAAVMQGYWRLAEATAEAIPADGWLRTGDIGRKDANGYVFVLDRARDTIISGGENVYPAEVENAIFGHPGVADVAVIGVPSQKWGEEVMAIVVARENAAHDAESIIAWARARIAAFKAPKRIVFIDELPRNAAAKVLRRVLREPYWAGRETRIG